MYTTMRNRRMAEAEWGQADGGKVEVHWGPTPEQLRDRGVIDGIPATDLMGIEALLERRIADLQRRHANRPKDPDEDTSMAVRCVATGVVYPSLRRAAKEHGLSINTVRRAAATGVPYRGVAWEFVEGEEGR